MLPLLPSGDNLGAKQEQREHPAGVWGLLWRREGRQEWVHLDEADSKTGSRGEVSDGVWGEEGGTQPESGDRSVNQSSEEGSVLLSSHSSHEETEGLRMGDVALCHGRRQSWAQHPGMTRPGPASA